MTNINNDVLYPIVLSLPIFFFFFFYFPFKKQKLPLPPGPFPWPIIGNLLKIDPKKPHISLAELAKSYGPLMTLRLGTRLFVVASSPEAAKEVYKTNDKVLSGRYVPEISRRIPESFASAIAVSDPADERWRALRGTLHSSMFTPSALESSSQLRVDKANEMINFLRLKSGKVVNITDVTYAAIINTWTGLLVSRDFLKSWDDVGELRASTRELVEYAIPGLPDLFPSLSWFDSLRKKNIDNYTVAKGTLWGEILRGKRSAGNNIIRDYMDVLINKSYSDDQINNILTELLVTAETVAIAVEWAIAELVKNQETLAVLRKELDEATVVVDLDDINHGEKAKAKLLRERDLEKLPYLQAVIKEALRLHPPTPLFLPRKATETCHVMNYEIPKDCLVMVNLYTVATDPVAWADEPLKFKPERFLNKKNLDVRGTSYELLPFGGGRRVCSGYALALKEMQLLIASLVNAFTWSLPGCKNPAELDMSEYFGTTLGLANPLQLVPEIKNDLKIQA